MRNVTKKQHYIPQMILRRHVVPYHNVYTYFYDKLKGITRLVPPKSVAAEDYLYELRNSDGTIDAETMNLIEHNYSSWEGQWDMLFRRVEKHDRLSNDDMCQLYFVVIMQLIRTPTVINAGKKFASETVWPDLPMYVAHNMFLAGSSLVGDLTPTAKPFIDSMVTVIKNYEITILTSDIPFILATENPVQAWCFSDIAYMRQHVDAFLFPFSSRCCIMLTLYKKWPFYYYISSKQASFINARTIESDNQYFIGSVDPKQFDSLV